MILSRITRATLSLLFVGQICLSEEEGKFIQLLHDQPNYLLLGKPETKIQFSFKAKVMPNVPIFLAYSQRIFWDLFEESSPFIDINYHPSTFYRIKLGPSQQSTLDLIAYEHESNGKGDSDSRSWDRAGVRVLFGRWMVRGWVPFNYDPKNRDLAEYRGIYEASYTIQNVFGPSWAVSDLIIRCYPGGPLYINPLQGGQELTLRVRGQDSWFLTNLVFQIFQGYGENLLNYHQRHWGFRAGIGI